MPTLKDRQDETRARNQQQELAQKSTCRTFEQRGLGFEIHYT